MISRPASRPVSIRPAAHAAGWSLAAVLVWSAAAAAQESGDAPDGAAPAADPRGADENPAPPAGPPGEDARAPDAARAAEDVPAAAAEEPATDEPPPAEEWPPPAGPSYETVVTATRYDTAAGNVPETVTIVGRREAAARSAVHGDDLLRGAAAVTVRRPQGPANPFPQVLQMRGVSGISRVLVLIDDQPINDALTGSPNLGLLPTERIRRIEIVRGPYSALWGSQAMAGLVHVVTLPGGEDPGLTLSAAAGPDDTVRISGSAAGAVSWFEAAGTYDLRTTGNYLALDGEPNLDYRHHRLNYRLDAGRGGELSGTLAGGLFFSNMGFNQYVDLRRIPYLGFYLRNEGRNEKDDVYQRLSGRWRPLPELEFRAAAGVSYQWARFHLVPVVLEGTLPPYTPERNTYEATAWRLEGSGRWAFADWGALVLGLDQVWDLGRWDNQVLEDGTLVFGMKSQVSTTAAYGQLEFDPWDERLKVIAGVRMDHHSTFGFAVSPKGGVSFEPVAGTVLRASGGRAFRSPSLMELYSPPWVRIPPYPSVGNPDLEPETLWSVDAGVEQRIGAAVRARVAGFYIEGQNPIQYRLDLASGMEPWVNAEDYRSTGLELEIALGPPGPFDARLTYAFTHTEDLGTGLSLDYVPEHTVGLLLMFRVPIERWSLEGAFDLQVLGPRPHTNPRNLADRTMLPAHAVGQLLLRARRGPWSLFAEFRNLWDAEYVETKDNPAPRFQFLLGTRFELAGWDPDESGS